MGILPWGEPLEGVSRCYQDLRDLALEAVDDPSQVISPIAILNISCAGWALEEGYDFGAVLFMLGAIPRMGMAHGRATWIELFLEAETIGRRIHEMSLEIGLKELLTRLLYDRHQLARLRQRAALYRQEIGSVLTASTLRAVMPNLTTGEVTSFLEPLNAALAEFDIITPQRWMPFLAECAEESSELRSMTENPSPYASSQSKYKGRGAMQLTTEPNYRNAGNALGLDLVNKPEIVASDASVGFRAGGWFWWSNKLNERADRVQSITDFDKISKAINRGNPNAAQLALGNDVRRKYFQRAKDAWAEYKNRCQTALLAGKIVQI